MAAPTITDYFGPGSKVVSDLAEFTETISAQNPVLMIPMSALLATGLSDPESMGKPDPVFFAVFKRVHAASRADVDEKTYLEVSEPSLNLTARDGKVMESLDYRITAFRNRSQVIDFDPDQLIPTYAP